VGKYKAEQQMDTQSDEAITAHDNAPLDNTTVRWLAEAQLSPPVMLVASFCGIGFWQPAPGTLASLFALPIGLFILLKYNLFVLLFFTGALFLCGLWASHIWLTQAAANNDNIQSPHKPHDPQEIVVDEVVGMWLTLAFIPPMLAVPSMSFILSAIACFALFRVFDIIKPWPISFIERKTGGAWGVMLDDIIAAIFAGGVLWILQFSIQ